MEYALIPEGSAVPENLKQLGISVYYISKSKTTTGIKKGELAFEGKQTKSVQDNFKGKFKARNEVEKNIISTLNIQKMNESQLQKKFKKSKDPEEKRDIIGALISKKTVESKKFLMEVAKTTDDEMMMADIAIGLSPYGND